MLVLENRVLCKLRGSALWVGQTRLLLLAQLKSRAGGLILVESLQGMPILVLLVPLPGRANVGTKLMPPYRANGRQSL